MLAGLLIVLVMRMLGELAVANPTVGSFRAGQREPAGPDEGELRSTPRLPFRARPGPARRRR